MLGRLFFRVSGLLKHILRVVGFEVWPFNISGLNKSGIISNIVRRSHVLQLSTKLIIVEKSVVWSLVN